MTIFFTIFFAILKCLFFHNELFFLEGKKPEYGKNLMHMLNVIMAFKSYKQDTVRYFN
jgi:hypothetical protein